MNPIDHERCSERLNPYIGGTLGPDEAEEVRAHLTECSMCRQEQAALMALTATPLEGLRSDESERLHAAVLAEIASQEDAAPAAVIPLEPRRSWAPRIAQFMAAAAVIALAAIYLTNPQVSPIIAGGDDAETADTLQDPVDERVGRASDDRRSAEAPDTTNDGGGAAEEEVAGFDSGTAGGSDGGGGADDSDQFVDEEGNVIGAAPGGGTAPTQDTGREVAALKAKDVRFGAGAAYSRQQR